MPNPGVQRRFLPFSISTLPKSPFFPAQLDYYQSVLDKMGRETVDAFAHFFVIPQGNLTPWVERNDAPGKTLVVTAGDRSLPLTSYPRCPKYIGGPPEQASSYISAAR